MIYVIGFQIEEKIYAKIGVCERNIEDRVKELQTGNPFELQLFGIIVKNNENEKNYYEIEKELHYRYKNCRLKGEWFEFSYKYFNIFMKEKIENHKAIMYRYDKEYDKLKKPKKIIKIIKQSDKKPKLSKKHFIQKWILLCLSTRYR